MIKLLSKSKTLIAPISGKAISITEVPDPIFSDKLIGDGLAFIPSSNTLVAPCDGIITTTIESGHAISLLSNDGLEILIHIGLETVSLEGDGFEVLVNVDDNVKAGTPLINIDTEFIKSKGLNLVTPLVIVNHDILKSLKPKITKEVIANKTTVLEYSLK